MTIENSFLDGRLNQPFLTTFYEFNSFRYNAPEVFEMLFGIKLTEMEVFVASSPNAHSQLVLFPPNGPIFVQKQLNVAFLKSTRRFTIGMLKKRSPALFATRFANHLWKEPLENRKSLSRCFLDLVCYCHFLFLRNSESD